MSTPRTDAELDSFADDQRGAIEYNGKTFIAFARQLETELQSALREVEELKEIKAWQASTIDHLLAHCGDSECSECAKFVCPHKEPLHFHHDGCPSCFSFERLEQAVEELKRDKERLDWLEADKDDEITYRCRVCDAGLFRQSIDNAMREEK